MKLKIRFVQVFWAKQSKKIQKGNQWNDNVRKKGHHVIIVEQLLKIEGFYIEKDNRCYQEKPWDLSVKSRMNKIQKDQKCLNENWNMKNGVAVFEYSCKN